MIEVNNVSVRYSNGVEALNNVTVAINPGEFVFVVGPTGSGKSTFLKLLYREVVPSAGEVFVAGADVVRMRPAQVPHFRRHIGVVFQDYRLLPYKTVWENVAFALQVTGTRQREIKERVPAILKMVGLESKHKSFPDQLSGGEQQRVSIARALVNAPALLVADEPTGNLDPTTSMGIMQLLDAVHRAGTTVVIATHDKTMVDAMQKRVLMFDNGLLCRDEHVGRYDADQEAIFRSIEEAVGLTPEVVA